MTPVLHVCYVIVGSGWDRHAMMAWLSARSLRLQDQKVRIVIVVEGLTPTAADEVRSRFGDIADVVLERRSEWTDPVTKSRYHRMRLREYLPGPLLYVDSDTLVVRPVAEVVDCDGDVGAVMDFNHDATSPWNPPDLAAPFAQRGWTYPLPRWLNAGVYFLRDTPAVHRFCEEWIERWKTPPAGSAHTWDQSTFNSAVWASGVKLAVLPNGFNAMVVKPFCRFSESRILHFFGSTAEQQGTLLEHLLQVLQATGEFDMRAYRRSLRQGHHWGPNPEPWQLHRSGNVVRAGVAKISRMLLGRRAAPRR
jgi:hypothetical protein